MGASEAEIKAAYRALAKQHHPDVTGTSEASDQFLRIQSAYEILSDADQRRAYDQTLPVVKPQPAPSSGTARVRTASYGGSVVEDPSQAAKVDAGRYANDLKRLQEYVRAGKLPEAERLARVLIDAEPRLPIPHAVMGEIMLAKGNRPAAAEYFGYASQMDPGNREYLDKYEMSLATIKTVDVSTGRKGETITRTVYAEQAYNPMPIALAIGAIAAAASSVTLSDHPAWLPKLPLVNSWSGLLFLMLFVAGLALGAGLSCSRLVDNFALSQNSTVAKFAPGAILGVIAIVNFWAAALVYLLGGLANRSFHQSTTRFFIGVTICTLVLTGAASTSKQLEPLQVLLWGGNVIYLAGLGGWVIADSFRQR